MTDSERKQIEQMILQAFGPIHETKSDELYVIEYDSGFGMGKMVVRATSLDEATQQAYARAAEIWDSNMYRKARKYDHITDSKLEGAP